ncbi:hypothetical protein DPMN_113441 [Dreissena polymorpha]|uniref:Uncharacterized protein n=1 Tax=Dreissena polymorpha TaxID=45954 RepID=A0A9D4QRV3_DREPO|nr:hypothetical protein DPMN_113441 [Dreissena polymorpha]
MHREMKEIHKEMYEMLKSFQNCNKHSAQEQDYNFKGPPSPIICCSCDEEGHARNRFQNRKTQTDNDGRKNIGIGLIDSLGFRTKQSERRNGSIKPKKKIREDRRSRQHYLAS